MSFLYIIQNFIIEITFNAYDIIFNYKYEL